MPQKPLPSDKISVALQRIAAWRAAPTQAVACPACDATGVEIIDQSARPYAEWYALRCAACGLDATLQLPMAPPFPGGDAT
jgi:hypothetical protein